MTHWVRLFSEMLFKTANFIDPLVALFHIEIFKELRIFICWLRIKHNLLE